MTCSLKYPWASRRKLLFSLMEKLLTLFNLCYRRNPARRKLHKARFLILQHKSGSLHFLTITSRSFVFLFFSETTGIRLPSCEEQESNDLRRNLLSEQVFRYQSSRRCNIVEKSTAGNGSKISTNERSRYYECRRYSSFLGMGLWSPESTVSISFFRRLNRLDKRRNKGRGDTQAAASLSNLLCLCNLFIYFNNGISKFPATNLSKSTDKIIFHFLYIMYIIRVVVKRLNFFRDGDRITREKYHNRNNNQNCIIPLGKIK